VDGHREPEPVRSPYRSSIHVRQVGPVDAVMAS
jgi:hypothetical protein